MNDFRKQLSEVVMREKLNADTYRNLEDMTGVSASTLKNMVGNRNIRLGTVIAVLEATGYELVIRKKEETR